MPFDRIEPGSQHLIVCNRSLLSGDLFLGVKTHMHQLNKLSAVPVSLNHLLHLNLTTHAN